LQRSREEVGVAHPHLEGAEGVFDGLSSDAHRAGMFVQPPLHRVQHGFVFPAAQAPITTGGAVGTQRATRARRRPVDVDRLAALVRAHAARGDTAARA